MNPRRCCALALFVALLVTGCGATGTGVGADAPSGNPAPPGSSAATTPKSHPAGAIPTGAGPQSKYTTAAQPPAGSCHYRYENGEPLPDLTCTPGAVSPAVTQANLATTICRKGGYTGGIRPPESVTGKEKRANAASYGYTGAMGDAEYDHLLSGVAAVMCGI